MSERDSSEEGTSQTVQQTIVNWMFEPSIPKRTVGMGAKLIVEGVLMFGVASAILAYLLTEAVNLPIFEILADLPYVENSFPVAWTAIWAVLWKKMWCYTTRVKPQ